MDNENLKTLLGSDFKDGMTSDEIVEVLSNKNLADLSKGEYVAKAKFDDVSKTKSNYEKQLADIRNANLTEQEKSAAENKALQEKLSTLQKQVTKSEIEKILIGTGLSDKEYGDFIDTMVLDDHDKSVMLASNFSKILKDKIVNAQNVAVTEATRATTIPPKPQSATQPIADYALKLQQVRQGELKLSASEIASLTRQEQMAKLKK